MRRREYAELLCMLVPAIVSATLVTSWMFNDSCERWSKRPMAVAVAKSTIHVPDDASQVDLASDQFDNLTQWSNLVDFTYASYKVNISSRVLRAYIDDKPYENDDNTNVKLYFPVDEHTPRTIEDVKSVYPCDSDVGSQILLGMCACIAIVLSCIGTVFAWAVVRSVRFCVRSRSTSYAPIK